MKRKNLKSLVGAALIGSALGMNVNQAIDFNRTTKYWDQDTKKHYAKMVKEDYKYLNSLEKVYTFGEYVAANKYLKKN